MFKENFQSDMFSNVGTMPENSSFFTLINPWSLHYTKNPGKENKQVSEKIFRSLSKLKRNMVDRNISSNSISPSAFNQNKEPILPWVHNHTSNTQWKS